MVMCDPAGRRISLGVKAAGALAAAELGDKAAKAAAGGGAFDLLIQDIAYARSARFDAPNAMLRFTEPVAADGPLLRDLMSAGDLVLSNSPLKLEFSLSGARNAICAALSACRIKHPICLAAD